MEVQNQSSSRFFPFPQGLDPKRGTREYRRLRGLTVLLLVVTALSFVCTLILSVMHFTGTFSVAPNVIAGVIVTIILLLQVFGFYRYANIRVSSSLLSSSYFFMAAGLMLMSGGHTSPHLPLMLTAPVVAFRIGGKDDGIMCTIYVGLFVLGLIATSFLDIPLPNLMAGASDIFLSSITWIISLLVILASLSAYDVDE